MIKSLSAIACVGIFSLSCLAAEPGDKGADNTKKNERDRSGETKTPLDQSNKPEDLKVTQDIRKAIVKDGGLSTTAKNVKIITADGKVTLRGPVNSAEEKTKIEAAAKSAAGSLTIDNQLEVKAPKAK